MEAKIIDPMQILQEWDEKDLGELGVRGIEQLCYFASLNKQLNMEIMKKDLKFKEA